ncbi:MAG: VWA domain-containing protein [Gemmatimonadales bacterium]|nr:MAG: VWA domain-containing protein [Gemmatimonadales bacterium]
MGSNRKNERGAVLLLVAVSLTVLLGIGGLALDSARGYLVKARLARAVDAAVLAGARSLRLGQDVARERATNVALVNGAQMGISCSDITVSFGTNAEGEQTVQVTAQRTMPTTLMRVLDIDFMNIRSMAVAAVPPVDLVLVLDQSGSLGTANAFDDLQDAAKLFVDYFDDNIDQLGLVSFQLRATERFALAGGFNTPIKNGIDLLTSFSYTNVGDGLGLAYDQITGPSVRQRSAKVVVFFTDGRPTAFRGDVNGQERMLSIPQTGTGIAGYYNNPDQLPTNWSPGPDGCKNVNNCFGWTEPIARAHGRQLGLDQATQLRNAGVFVYSIGLGNPNFVDPLWQPDMDYLAEIANVDGVAAPGKPVGKSYFAPSANELRSVFQQVASDLLVRLAQ